MDQDDPLLELIARYLRSKNLNATADILFEEKEYVYYEDAFEQKPSQYEEELQLSESLQNALDLNSGKKLSIAVPFANSQNLNQDEQEEQDETDDEKFVDSNSNHDEDDEDNFEDNAHGTEYNQYENQQTSSTTETLLKTSSWAGAGDIRTVSILNRPDNHSFHEEIDKDVYLDADEEINEEIADEITRTSSGVSRGNSRGNSVSSNRSESPSFASSSENEIKFDEWSDDEDPGYHKVQSDTLDYFQYSDDEDDIEEYHVNGDIESHDADPAHYDTPKSVVDEEEHVNPEEVFEQDLDITLNESRDTLYNFSENLRTQTETENFNDDWDEPATQDESVNIRDFSGRQEAEKLNQILRNHIQSQKDEYYQETSENFGYFNKDANEDKEEVPTELSKEVLPEIDEKIIPTMNETDNSADLIDDQFEMLNLTIYCERGRTGLQVQKDFPIELNTVIAGKYEIMEYLGSAAFSKAVRCRDLITNQHVCIKIIKNNKEYLDQSLDEIRLLKFINSRGNADEKHVLQLYDYFYHKEHLFIVCELLRDNLYEFYKHNRESGDEFYFTLERLQRITKQCLTALEFIHSLRIIHCDLKPENILVKSYSRCEVKIIDFGSSCFTGDHLGTYVQSRSYRAPEVILGCSYDGKIDMWSLGCIIAELWTGRVLFHNESISTLLARIVGIMGPFDRKMLKGARHAYKYFTKNCTLYEKKEGVPGVLFLKPKRTTLRARLKTDDEEFLDFLSKLLAPNPRNRMTAAQALQHPWIKNA